MGNHVKSLNFQAQLAHDGCVHTNLVDVMAVKSGFNLQKDVETRLL